MIVLPPIELRDGEKLEILQGFDRYRQWRSLDEKRYCIVCCTVITGREIQVVGDTHETGAMRVVCPTRNCHSIPMDWVLPTNEILAKGSAPQGDDQLQKNAPSRAA